MTRAAVVVLRSLPPALALALAPGIAAQGPPNAFAPVAGGRQYFAVLVADAERSAEWYRTTLGLRELDRSAAADGSWQIVNLTNDHLFVEIIRDDRARRAADPIGFAKVGYEVADVDRVADAIERTTGQRPRALDFPPHGIRLVQLRDPDGNIIQLFARLRAGGP